MEEYIPASFRYTEANDALREHMFSGIYAIELLDRIQEEGMMQTDTLRLWFGASEWNADLLPEFLFDLQANLPNVAKIVALVDEEPLESNIRTIEFTLYQFAQVYPDRNIAFDVQPMKG